jgi:hypothetical protein
MGKAVPDAKRTRGSGTPQPAVAELQAEVEQLRGEVVALREEFENRVEALCESLVGMEIAVVEGYVVKLWPDAESDWWIAECPTVKCVCQEESRDAVAVAIRETIPECLAALDELDARPPRDVPVSDA